MKKTRNRAKKRGPIIAEIKKKNLIDSNLQHLKYITNLRFVRSVLSYSQNSLSDYSGLCSAHDHRIEITRTPNWHVGWPKSEKTTA
jgi:hypothetical protein